MTPLVERVVAMFRTKQALLALLVVSTVLLGAGFGFLAPVGDDAPTDQSVADDADPSAGGATTPVSVDETTATPRPDDVAAGEDGRETNSQDSTGESVETPSATPTVPQSTGSAGDDGETESNPTTGGTSSETGTNGGSGSSHTETLDLRLGLQSGQTILDVGNAIPGQSGANTVFVRNAGSLDGQLAASVTIVDNYENGLTEAERHVDQSPDRGELGEWIQFRVSVSETDGDGRTYLVGSADDYVSASQVGDKPTVTLPSDERRTLLVEWCLSPEAGNEIQSDSVRVSFGFSLVQS